MAYVRRLKTSPSGNLWLPQKSTNNTPIIKRYIKGTISLTTPRPPTKKVVQWRSTSRGSMNLGGGSILNPEKIRDNDKSYFRSSTANNRALDLISDTPSISFGGWIQTLLLKKVVTAWIETEKINHKHQERMYLSYQNIIRQCFEEASKHAVEWHSPCILNYLFSKPIPFEYS